MEDQKRSVTHSTRLGEDLLEAYKSICHQMQIANGGRVTPSWTTESLIREFVESHRFSGKPNLQRVA